MITLADAEVYNVPDYANNYGIWVVRLVDGILWFYGAYDDERKARKIANELGNGLAVRNSNHKEKA